MQTNKIEFYRLQAEAGLSNRQAAGLFNVTIRSIEKWRIESPSAPKAVMMCLESIVSGNPVTFSEGK
jgi:hypothetical protein